MSGALKDSAPVSAEEFALLIKKCAPLSDKIAVAVSGGADSMALAFCLKRWAQRPLIALIVEHGLREESAAEALTVKKQLEAMGIAAEILHWKHEKLETRIEATARKARYELLIEACKRLGAGDLLTAHHQTDQAETILLRLSKGSGIDGLAGIAAASRRDTVRLLRPFLSLPKERLVATCIQAGISFVSDPTNASQKFARARLRKIMPLLAKEGLSENNLAALATHVREAKDALDFYAKQFLDMNAQTEIGGSVKVGRASLKTVPRAIALRALAACLRYVHEEDYPPENTSLSALLDEILLGNPEITRTFYGCIISATEDRISILREPSAATEILILKPGATILWDKRWLVTAEKGAKEITIRALGTQTHDMVDQLAPDLRRRIPQGRIRASLPALWEGDRFVAIPSFEEKAAFRLSYARQVFL